MKNTFKAVRARGKRGKSGMQDARTRSGKSMTVMRRGHVYPEPLESLASAHGPVLRASQMIQHRFADRQQGHGRSLRTESLGLHFLTLLATH